MTNSDVLKDSGQNRAAHMNTCGQKYKKIQAF